jgi:hypothetical protein
MPGVPARLALRKMSSVRTETPRDDAGPPAAELNTRQTSPQLSV